MDQSTHSDAKPVSEWARLLGVSRHLLGYRLQGEPWVDVRLPSNGRAVKGYSAESVARVIGTGQPVGRDSG